MRKSGIVLVMVLVAAILGSGAFWFANKKTLESPLVTDNETQSHQERRVNELSQASCKIGNGDTGVSETWKVYNNESPKFSFRYPQEWSEKVEKKPNGETSVSLYDSKKTCSIEGSPALCGIHVSVFPITGEESLNVKYLKRLEEAKSKGQAQIRMVCVNGKEATEITDYLRHEIIFDREGHSFMVTAENFGSDDVNKVFWDAVDSIGSGFRFE